MVFLSSRVNKKILPKNVFTHRTVFFILISQNYAHFDVNSYTDFLILSNHTSKMILKMSLYTFVRDLLRHYLWTCELWSMVVWLKASPAPLDDQKAMVLKFTDWRSHCYIKYRICWTWSSVGLAGLRGGTNPQDPGWKGSELLL